MSPLSDPTSLAAKITEILIPFLRAGGATGGNAGASVPAADKNNAAQIWEKLPLQVQASALVKKVKQDPARANDARIQNALELEIEDALKEAPALANQLRAFVLGDVNTVNLGAGARAQQVAVGREIQQTIYNIAPDALKNASVPEIERAYFRSLAVECAQLPLGVVDPRFFESARETRVTVAQVYIDLDVTPPARQTREESFLKRLFKLGREEEQPDAPKRTPVLEVLARDDLTRVVLLGDMGSGKSTCVQYLAFVLASRRGEALTDAPANREASVNVNASPLQQLLPVRLILREAARYVPPGDKDGNAEMLWQAIRADMDARLGKQAAEKFFPVLQTRLLSEPALVLLDGLDEVPDAEQRREHLIQCIEKFCHALPTQTRVVVTARPYAYAEPQWQLKSFTALQLEPFSNKQIARFIERWYQAVRPEMKWDEPTALGKANDLTRALAARRDLGDIATRPLLLTLMATVSSSWGTLPNDRFDLYEEMVKLFISRWQRAREVRDENGTLITEQPIAVALNMPETELRAGLHKLAFRVHERQGREKRDDDSADISRGEILEEFENRVGKNATPGELLKYLDTRAGLLISRAPGIYVFPHRSFQEYLAACEISDRVNSTGALRDLARTDARWWREVFLWSAGIKARGGIDNVLHIVKDVVYASTREVAQPTEADYRSAVLAALALHELKTKPVGQAEYEIPLQRVREWLIQLIESSQLNARERAEAGDVLARLHDPRRGVGVNDNGLPDLLFCEIPAGDFRMGDTLDDWGGKKEITCTKLDKPYYITRYPITNAQFDAFLNADDGFKNPKWWEGLAQTDNQRVPPKQGGVFDLPNHPVVNVTWYQAVAFCRWANSRWLGQTPSAMAEGELQIFNPVTREINRKSKIEILKYEICLPSEAEWEKAARTRDGRKYPWGPDITTEHANYRDTEINATSAVGCFPKGTNEYGIMDMSGNVWEWCATKWVEEYKNYSQSEDNALDGDSSRVLRGGSYFYGASRVRCAWRNRLQPDNLPGTTVFAWWLLPFDSEL